MTEGSFIHTPSSFLECSRPEISRDFGGSHYRLGFGCQFLGVSNLQKPFRCVCMTITEDYRGIQGDMEDGSGIPGLPEIEPVPEPETLPDDIEGQSNFVF